MTTPHQDKRFYHIECGSAPYGFFHVFERGPTEPHKFLATVPGRRAADDIVDALNNEAAQPLAAALRNCDKAFASWQVGQIPGRPEDILALITEVRDALRALGVPAKLLKERKKK